MAADRKTAERFLKAEIKASLNLKFVLTLFYLIAALIFIVNDHYKLIINVQSKVRMVGNKLQKIMVLFQERTLIFTHTNMW